MTFILMVACKDSFYMFADTLTANLENKTFSLKTQKSFFSEKHKIGMCISGDATLKPNYSLKAGDEEKVLYTDSIVRKFFEEIESKDGITIDNFYSELEQFLLKEFAQYKDNFNERATYFYGGFKTNKDGSKTTVLRAHFEAEFNDDGTKTKEGHSEERMYNEAEAAYFTNLYPTFSQCLDQIVNDPNNKDNKTHKNILENYLNNILLPYVITRTCMLTNTSYFSRYGCLSISDVLAFSKVLINAPARTNFIRYWYFSQCPVLSDDQIYLTNFAPVKEEGFGYIQYRSLADSAAASAQGKSELFSIDKTQDRLKLAKVNSLPQAQASAFAKTVEDRRRSSSSERDI